MAGITEEESNYLASIYRTTVAETPRADSFAPGVESIPKSIAPERRGQGSLCPSSSRAMSLRATCGLEF